jgi:hypothetical protein
MSDMEVSCEVYTIDDYKDWDHRIFASAQAFKARYKVWPNILLGTPSTLEAFDLFMSQKLLKEGKVEKVTQMGKFACKDFELEVCLDPELEDHTFALIYDEEAKFVEEEPEEADEAELQGTTQGDKIST